jgi:arylsulfatase A-like enzyme
VGPSGRHESRRGQAPRRARDFFRHEPRGAGEGVHQDPIEGVSMTYTWDDAKAPSRRTTQYFEMLGNRAI